MHIFYRTLSGLTALAVLGAVMTGAPRQASAAGPQAQGAPAAAAAEKKPKDTGEYDIYNEVIKDIGAQNWNKAVTDLNTWTQKYPESDFKDDRLYFLMQAYSGTNQPAKVVDAGGQLTARDLATIFKDPKAGPQQIVTVYYLTAASVQQIPSPTPEQLAAGEKAATSLLAYVPTFFSADRKPAATSDADWAKARNQMETVAKGTQMWVAMRPAVEAAQKKDWDTAVQAYTKALQQHPDSAQISYALGSALISSQKPENVAPALYEVARAASLDPAKGGIADPKARADIEAYLKKIYARIHGSEEGLDQLRQVAVTSPLPPADFHVKSSAELASENEQKFAQQYPQLALWLGIKKQLADVNGQQYFDTQLKDAEVPKLKGMVVEGKPACKSKEVLVSVPEPDQQNAPVVISLKLDTPLTGKPLPGEIQWQGVPSAFNKDPLLLTMDTEKAKIEGLKEERCVAAPARPAVKKAAPKKK